MDNTGVDTISQTNLAKFDLEAGATAEQAEKGKKEIARRYMLEPIEVEPTGVHVSSTRKLFNTLGTRMQQMTGDSKETQWLKLRILPSIQRGNAVCIELSSRVRSE